MGENLVEAVFMNLYRRLAVNSIQNQLKKGSFWPGLSKKLLFRNHFQMLFFAFFNVGYHKDVQSVGILGAHTAYSLNFGMD